MIRRRAFVLAAGAVAALGACGDERMRPPAAVAEVPDIMLFGLDATRLRLSHWRGRMVVLNVWASWCAPCRAEMASLQALSDALDAARGAVVGLSVDDDLHLVREYLRGSAIRFPIVTQDPAQPAGHALGVRALPATLVVGADGRLAGREDGPRDWADPVLQARLRLPLRARLDPERGDA